MTLPAVTAGSAFFVQLQISRVFWILDLLGVVSVLWLLLELTGPARPGAPAHGGHRRAARAPQPLARGLVGRPRTIAIVRWSRGPSPTTTGPA